QRIASQVDAVLPEALAELDSLLEDADLLWAGHLVPPLLVLVDEQHEPHGVASFPHARRGRAARSRLKPVYSGNSSPSGTSPRRWSGARVPSRVCRARGGSGRRGGACRRAPPPGPPLWAGAPRLR